MRRPSARLIGFVAALGLMAFGLTSAGTAAIAERASEAQTTSCPRGTIPRDGGCVPTARVADRIAVLARQAMKRDDPRAVIVSVKVGHRDVLTAAYRSSMSGVPATPDMHFRIGSVAIAYLTTLALQLQDEGRLSLHDPLSRWFPALPRADRITLRMLANSTSGYADYVPDKGFLKALYADVFRQWTPPELIRIGLSKPLACEPGTCWNYSHANFVILGEVLSKVTGRPVARERIIRPLGLRNTDSPSTPAIREPVLHAYTRERGRYEESTFWNPSWTSPAARS